jgi:hypothetical protein
MRILYYQPYVNGLGAAYWIYHGWRNAFKDLGHDFGTATLADDLKKRVEEFKPDIFFVPNIDDILLRNSDTLKWMRNKGVKVFLIVYWPPRPREVEVLKRENVADVYYGERAGVHGAIRPGDWSSIPSYSPSCQQDVAFSHRTLKGVRI